MDTERAKLDCRFFFPDAMEIVDQEKVGILRGLPSVSHSVIRPKKCLLLKLV